MGQGKLITIPFALGIDEQAAPRELEPRALRRAVNVRQRQLRALGVRADYTAQSMTEFDGTLIPYDLHTLNGRLFALGDRQSAGIPTDLFEFVEQPGGTWKGTLPVGADAVRVPPVTNIRNMGQVPDVSSQIQTARIAAVNGLVCMVYGFGQTAGGATSYVHIFRADTDSTIFLEPVSLTNLHVVAAGNSFWILGVDSANDLIGRRFDTTVDDNLQGATTLYTGTVTNSFFSACHVDAVSVTQFAVFIRDGSTTVVRRFNEAGVQQASFAGPAVAADALAIEADSVINQITVVTRVGAADANASTYNLTTNALLAGPTAVFGQAVTARLAVVRCGRGSGNVDVVSDDTDDTVRGSTFAGATHAGAGSVDRSFFGYRLGGYGVGTSNILVYPMVSADSSNHLVLVDLRKTSGQTQFVGASQDQGFAHPLTFSANKGGQVCVDIQDGLYYWSRLLEGTDTQQIAGVSEFVLGSTARRQSCQVGNTLLMAGGVGLSFDSRQLVESNFIEQPVIQALTPSNSTGDLIPGAEYDYVAVVQWIDAQGRQAKSRVSEITTVTMGPADNTVTGTIFAPHTMRKDSNSGSTPVISLFRTDAIANLDPAVVFGGASIDAPSGVLTGLTLRIVSPAGGLDVVTFTAGAINSATILAEINAVTGADVVATNEGGVLKLTTAQTGQTAAVLVQRVGTANAILGFSSTEDTVGLGATTITKGSIFHLCSTTVVPISNEFGEPVTVVDTLLDADLLQTETLYTQGEQGGLTGILQREAPPPFRFCTAVGQRAFLGGLPDPTEVAISFELSPAEALSFSSEFAFRAWLDSDVTAVGSLDGRPVAFTAFAPYLFTGAMPNDQGADGELGPAIRVPSEGGCDNADSILETSAGLFYQNTSGKLMLLPRGGSAPVWIGQHIHETLKLFPRITGAAYVDDDFCAVFACQNAAGTASVLIVYDLRIGQWYRDEFASAQIIRAAVPYLGKLAYIDSATVRIQSDSLTPATFIPYGVETGSLAPFEGGHAGHGEIISVQVDGEFRANATLTGRISYDDGVNFTTLVVKTFATPTFVSGQSFSVQWFPRVRKGSSYVLRFDVTDLAGAASEGLILNSYTIEPAPAVPLKRQRTTAAQRG